MCIANRPKVVACFIIFLACLTSINVCIWSKHGFTFGMFVPIYELVHRWSEGFPASVESIFRANRRCFSRLSTFWAPAHSTFLVQQTTKTLSNLHGCFQQPQQIIEPTFLRTLPKNTEHFSCPHYYSSKGRHRLIAHKLLFLLL